MKVRLLNVREVYPNMEGRRLERTLRLRTGIGGIDINIFLLTCADKKMIIDI